MNPNKARSQFDADTKQTVTTKRVHFNKKHYSFTKQNKQYYYY